MKIYGNQVRTAGAFVFNFVLLTALVCHRVESVWFWGAVGAFMALGALTAIGLEVLRLVAPDFTDEWWDPE